MYPERWTLCYKVFIPSCLSWLLGQRKLTYHGHLIGKTRVTPTRLDNKEIFNTLYTAAYEAKDKFFGWWLSWRALKNSTQLINCCGALQWFCTTNHQKCGCIRLELTFDIYWSIQFQTFYGLSGIYHYILSKSLFYCCYANYERVVWRQKYSRNVYNFVQLTAQTFYCIFLQTKHYFSTGMLF